MMEGRPHIVIGVMPPRFRFPMDDVELWAAIKDNMTGMPRNSRFMDVVGRLKARRDGLTAAQAEVDATSAQLEAAYPETNKGWRVRLAGAHEAVVGDTKPALIALAGAVGFVLLIACANVSNLLLARASSRRRESTIRLAVGAEPGPSGGAVPHGKPRPLDDRRRLRRRRSPMARFKCVVAFGPADIPRLSETAVDVPVLGFALLVAILAGRASFAGAGDARLAAVSRSRTAFGDYSTTGRSRVGAILIVCEVALAMTLAVAGALVLKSFARLTAVPPGFNSQRILSLKVFLTPPRYRSVASEKQYIGKAVDRMSSVPGVEAVAAISQLPLGDPSSGQPFTIEGRSLCARRASKRRLPRRQPVVLRHAPDSRAARARSLAKTIARTERWSSWSTRRWRARFWPNEDPIGRRIHWATGYPQFDTAPHTIVGVVADIKSSGLDKPERPAAVRPVHAARVSMDALEQLRRADARRAGSRWRRADPPGD